MNLLLKVGSVVLAVYLFKSGTVQGGALVDKVINWAFCMVTRANLSTIGRELENDYGFTGKFPDDFDAWLQTSVKLVGGGELHTDFWGQPFRLDVRSREARNGAYQVRSCGIDKSCGTDDDIIRDGIAYSYR